jgi:AcrR family transcriptional regulator
MTERAPRADARRNRERVLAAARDAFAVSGLGVPLDEVAARAGVGPGTVYRHFPSKQALFEAVMVARVHDLVRYAGEQLRTADPGTAFFDVLTRLGVEVGAKRDLSDALDGGDAAWAGELADARDELHGVLGELLDSAQRAGTVRADITLADLVAMLKGLRASVRGAEDSGLAARLLAVVRDGMRTPRGDAVEG